MEMAGKNFGFPKLKCFQTKQNRKTWYNQLLSLPCTAPSNGRIVFNFLLKIARFPHRALWVYAVYHNLGMYL